MQQCPQCKSEEVHRSRARTKWEAWRKEITGKRPHRCHKCGWRGWGLPSGPKFNQQERDRADRALHPEPPNLAHTGLGRDGEDIGELNLDQLDVFDPKRSSTVATPGDEA